MAVNFYSIEVSVTVDTYFVGLRVRSVVIVVVVVVVMVFEIKFVRFSCSWMMMAYLEQCPCQQQWVYTRLLIPTLPVAMPAEGPLNMFSISAHLMMVLSSLLEPQRTLSYLTQVHRRSLLYQLPPAALL